MGFSSTKDTKLFSCKLQILLWLELVGVTQIGGVEGGGDTFIPIYYNFTTKVECDLLMRLFVIM